MEDKDIVKIPAKKCLGVYFQGGLIIKPTRAIYPLKLGTLGMFYFHGLANM